MTDVSTLDPELHEWLPGKSLEQLIERAKLEARYGKQWRPLYLCGLISQSAPSDEPLKYQADLLLARLSAENQQLDYALGLYKDTLESIRKNFGTDHPIYACGLLYKADSLLKQRKWTQTPKKLQKEALSAVSRAIASIEKNNPSDYQLVRANYILYRLLRQYGNEIESRAALAQAISKCELICGADDPELAFLLTIELSDQPGIDADELNAKESRIKKAIEIFSNCFDASNYDLRKALALYEKLLRRQGKIEEADKIGAAARADRGESSESNETLEQQIIKWRKLNNRPDFDLKGY